VGVAARKAILEQGHVGPTICRLMLDGSTHIPERPDAVYTLHDHALYYIPADRIGAFDPLRHGNPRPIPIAELPQPAAVSLEICQEALATAGIRVAIADVTSPDVATGPFRVARALGTHMQPIHFGHHLQRLANPRLRALIHNGLNPYPHPLA
jgi:ribosomal protein S12 methylthiotransferase accessory factor